MKAVVYRRYGSPDELAIEDRPVPMPGPREILVRVRAVGLNGSDWEGLTGEPLYARIWGLLRPSRQVLGSDIAGVVEGVGSQVVDFAPGDEVYGDTLGKFGGFAEFACAPAKLWRRKPPALSFEQAAALPQGGLIAFQSLQRARVGSGSSVLINGAGGSAGSYAVLIAKSLGARVTAVDAAAKLDFVSGLGADRVIDYREIDFASENERYDFILDLVATRSVFQVRGALNPGGIYSFAGGRMSSLLQTVLLGPLVSTGGRRLGVLALAQNLHLEELADWVASGRIQPAIDRTFPLDQVPTALRYMGEGHARGKVLIAV